MSWYGKTDNSMQKPFFAANKRPYLMYDLMILMFYSQLVSSKGHRAWCLLNCFWSYSICAKAICLYRHMVICFSFNIHCMIVSILYRK